METRFADCHLLRIQRSRQEDLRIFALEPVQIYLIHRSHVPAASGWQCEPSLRKDELGNDSPGFTLSAEDWTSAVVHSRRFNPGLVVVPLQGMDVVPLVRVLK